MRSHSCLRRFIPLAIFFVFVSCKTTNLPSIGSGDRPFQLEEDEKQVWQNAKQIEHLYDKSGLLYKDDNLQVYLEAIAHKLISPNFQSQGLAPRIKVIMHPFLNAFALPNGVVYFHTGLLARMDNEAQLATVLGHELTHFTHRHAVKEMRGAQNKETFLNVLQGMVVVAGSAYAGGQFGASLGQLTEQVGSIWTLASVTGYSRELESEADKEGLKAMVQAGYDPKEAVKVFEHLQRELDERKIKEPFFFGTHPRLQERIDNYQRLLTAPYAARAKEEERLINSGEFLGKIEQLLLDNAILDLQISRHKTAQAGIEKLLLRQPHCARAYFLLGEVHRRSGRGEPYTQRAINAYQEAARLEPTYANPHRELGLLYRTQNRHEETRAEFEKYLTLNPKALDANIIRGYLEGLSKP